MPVYDGTYQPMLGGVSQQNRDAMLPGQVLEQLNMLTDPVTGLRRRLGFRFDTTETALGPAGVPVVTANCRIGLNDYLLTVGPYGVAARRPGYGKVITTAYLSGATADTTRLAYHRGDVYILNTLVKPGLADHPDAPALLEPKSRGFFYVKAGTFSKKYEIQFSVRLAGSPTVYTYWFWTVTPQGTSAGDANAAAPSAIADVLRDAIMLPANVAAHGCSAYTNNGALLLVAPAGAELNIFSSSGAAYVTTSRKGVVDSVQDLPSVMPEAASGYPVAVGVGEATRQYYYWDAGTQSWLECGVPGSKTGFSGMPLRLYEEAGELYLDASVWPARFAGDANTNPYPAFTDTIGITGMGSFQGRLCLLSGNYVCFSDSLRPNLFMRSTVVQLLDSDAIEVASGSASNAAYVHAVPYNRDLLLFSATQIALVPGLNAITPKTAQVVPTLDYEVDTSMRPAVAGNMVVFATPGADTSGEYRGMAALTPSQYTAGQYSADSLTDHLPQFLRGRPRLSACSGGGGLLCINTDAEPRSLWVMQYMWKQQELALVAWHKWTVPLDVVGMHMHNNRVVCAFLTGTAPNQLMCFASTSATEWNGSDLAGMVPYLDLYTTRTNVAPFVPLTLPIPVTSSVKACLKDGADAGEPVLLQGTSSDQVRIPAEAGLDGPVDLFIGYSYESAVVPNSPFVYGEGGKPVYASGVYWQNLRAHTADSGEFLVTVSSIGGEEWSEVFTPLSWAEEAAAPGASKVTQRGEVDVPLQGEAQRLRVRFSTTSTREMCFPRMDFTIKTERQRRRV